MGRSFLQTSLSSWLTVSNPTYLMREGSSVNSSNAFA